MFKIGLRICLILTISVLLGSFLVTKGEAWQFQSGEEINLKEVILADYQDKLWIVDPSTLEFTLFFAPEFPDLQSFGDVSISPQANRIYFIVIDRKKGRPISDINEEYLSTLVQFDLASGETTELFSDPHLARMSTVSSDGQMEMFFSNLPHPELAYYCLFNVNTRDCTRLERGVEINNIVWLNSNEFIGTSTGISKFVVDGENLEEQILVPITANIRGRFTVSHDLKTIFLIFTVLEGERYKPKLASFDLATQAYTELPYELSDIFAAINAMSVSPDNRWLAYKAGLQLNVLDLNTGASILQQENVLEFVWTPDSTSIIATIDPQNFGDPMSLVKIDVASGQITQSVELESMLYLITAYGSQ